MSKSDDEENISTRTVEIRREIELLKKVLIKSSNSPLDLILKNTSEKPNQLNERKTLQQAENLQIYLNSCRKGPDIYALFSQCSQSSRINIKIPETLLYVPSQSCPVFLWNNSFGNIASYINDQAIDKFFDTVEQIEVKSRYKVPKYIHIAMNDKITLCYSAFEAREVFENCPHYMHRLQRYIPPTTNLASKIRIHWSGSRIEAVCSISNNISLGKLERKGNLSFQPVMNNLKQTISYSFSSKILPTSFSMSMPFKPLHQKRSLKEKLNKPKNPFKTHIMVTEPCEAESLQIKPGSETLMTEEIHPDEDSFLSSNNQRSSAEENADIEKFIVKFSGLPKLKIIFTHQPIPELVKAVNALVAVINQLFLRKNNQLQELFVDFIKDSNEKWVLLSCKGYKIIGDELSRVLKPKFLPKLENIRSKTHIKKPFARDYEINVSKIDDLIIPERKIGNDTIIYDKNIEILAHSFEEQASKLDNSPIGNIHLKEIQESTTKSYLEQKKSDHLGRIPCNMIGIMPHKLDNPITSFIDNHKEVPIKPLKHRERFKHLYLVGLENKRIDLASKQLDEITKSFDKKLKAAQEGRKDANTITGLVNFLNSHEKLIEKSIQESYEKCKQSETLCPYFESRTNHEMERIHKGFYSCLKPGYEIGLRNKLKRSHKGLNISSNDFEEFVKNLTESLANNNFFEEEAKLITDRARSFEKEIVSIHDEK
ncbi:unnamed protein product [Blepharisma stoltei]|uniref:Uncharacterized protein n=1 Tax=Blepharisma stoltei TaxID=1481888 RepID=A0AAU9JFF8_9CILI|nr:unnamed protein product [Blepharisma stoltei]